MVANIFTYRSFQIYARISFPSRYQKQIRKVRGEPWMHTHYCCVDFGLCLEMRNASGVYLFRLANRSPGTTFDIWACVWSPWNQELFGDNRYGASSFLAWNRSAYAVFVQKSPCVRLSISSRAPLPQFCAGPCPFEKFSDQERAWKRHLCSTGAISCLEWLLGVSCLNWYVGGVGTDERTHSALGHGDLTQPRFFVLHVHIGHRIRNRLQTLLLYGVVVQERRKAFLPPAPLCRRSSDWSRVSVVAIKPKIGSLFF